VSKDEGDRKMEGIVLSYNRNRGWGFIGYEDGDIFFHVSALSNRKFVLTNDSVEFEIGERGGKPLAINIQVLTPLAPIRSLKGGQHGN
jgi:cold shock CspA family protein